MTSRLTGRERGNLRSNLIEPIMHFRKKGSSPFTAIWRLTKMDVTTRKPSYRLTYDDAVEVWLLHWKGIFQNRIAATFDTNPGRINEVLKERKFVGSRVDAMKRRTLAA